MNRLLILTILLFFKLNLLAQKAELRLFSKQETFILNNTSNGKVDYIRIINDSIAFGAILEDISTFDLSNSTINSQKAFYINAYNLIVISQIATDYPDFNPDKNESHFNANEFTVAGKPYTLNQLEKLLIANFNDWRIQWALVSGNGCSFPLKFYSARNVNEMLQKQQQDIYNSNAFIFRDDALKTIWLNPQFNVLEKQLEVSKTNLIVHLNLNRNAQLPFDYQVKYKPCNLLNDTTFNMESGTFSDSDTSDINNRFDIETGQDLPSNFIPKGRFEFRVNNILYTQTSVYNNKMNRIDEEFRYSYNSIVPKATYGISDYINVGLYYSVRHAVTDLNTENAFEVFTAPSKTKNINQTLQLFGKLKLYEKKSRLTILTAATMPLRTKKPYEPDNYTVDHYIGRVNAIYDFYLVYFLRTTLVAGNDFDYYPESKKTYYRFRPSFELNATIIQMKSLRVSAGIDLNWMYGQNGFINMNGREYATVNWKINKRFSMSGNFSYFFIGKNVGAGHYFNGGMRYLI